MKNKSFALIMSLLMTVALLAACGQPTAELESQSFTSVTVGLGYDYRPEYGKTNLNGLFDKGESLIANATFKFTPLEPKAFALGEIVPSGEPVIITTNELQDLVTVKLGYGVPHQVDIGLTDKPFGPEINLPPKFLELPEKYHIRYIPMIYCGGNEGVAIQDIEYCLKLRLVP
jgi:hypothetical protein